MKTDDQEQTLDKLIRLAGERPEIPMNVESRVYHRVQSEWQSATSKPSGQDVYANVHKSWRRGSFKRSLFSWLIPAGIAATAVIALFIADKPVVVDLQKVASVASVPGSGKVSSNYSPGAEVFAGDVLITGPGEGVSLLLARNESLRIDENTELKFDADDQLTLVTGRIYADTGQFAYRSYSLKVNTTFGMVTDVGTQFSVSSSSTSLQVAVREGRVDLQSADETYSTRMGQRLEVVAGAGADISELDPHDSSWDWIADLTPGFNMQNKSLLDFLRWASRETGRELVFETDASRMFAMRIDVHGSVDGLTPDEALEAILATTSVPYRIEQDRVVIEEQPEN